MAMSSINTTLATLAGGFVPMLLKNVLSSKGAKLSLKSISFKGQVDEIITGYKQYWPVLDLVATKDTPQDDDDDNDNKEDAEDASPDEKNKNGNSDKGKDKGEKGKDKKDDSKEKSNDVGTFVKKKSTCDKPDDKKNKETNGGAVAGKVEGRAEGGDGKGETETPPEDDNVVDLFLDLSVADTAAGWSIYGSSESLPEQPSFMPAYFNTDQFYVEPDKTAWKDAHETFDV